MYVCQFVSQSLISLLIGHLWGSTSETSGLVFIKTITFVWDIPGIFLNYFQIIMYFLYVCQSLISLPIGHFWGSTSETSGLVYSIGDCSCKTQLLSHNLQGGGQETNIMNNKTRGLRSWPPEITNWERYKRLTDRLEDIQELQNNLKIAQKYPRNVSKKLRNISYPELEISLYWHNFSKDVSQLRDWKTYKKFNIIWK